jgi:hypothetical protein
MQPCHEPLSIEKAVNLKQVRLCAVSHIKRIYEHSLAKNQRRVLIRAY